jgi:hypothetical protein
MGRKIAWVIALALLLAIPTRVVAQVKLACATVVALDVHATR